MARKSTYRKVMPQEGRTIRNATLYRSSRDAALYQGPQVPSLALKLAIYEHIQLSVLGVHWYTKKRHLTWCSTTERSRGISRKRTQLDDAQLFGVRLMLMVAGVSEMVEREMWVVPDPRLSDIARWAAHTNVSRDRVYEIARFIAGYN
ncbi:hypothetical protein C8T65DRAFT_731057 [Cerioporus squamosus]|nr:hypothetical protein C8T65DRAFT_731057 [Cerioporus squamosus]